jgi:cation diffusion facilitator CzcD-associated flavoprotein CzcO
LATTTPIVIIGAGPYGLSLAAHLQARGIQFRILGKPMHSWLSQMPRGMLLKSEGFASSLDDPAGDYPLAKFCAERGLPYQDIGLPVPVETFASYGLEFQRRFVPALEQRDVVQLSPSPEGFHLRLDDGETISARQVVVAVGVGHFPHVPGELAALPEEKISHSSHHADLSGFSGRDVLVVGGGASAVDVAALLHRAGSKVRLVARRKSIEFQAPPERRRRPLGERLRAPRSGLGIGWRSRLCEDAPWLFHLMPQDFRLRVVSRHLGPAPGWFVREHVEGHVPMLVGRHIAAADTHQGRARLRIRDNEGREDEITADHVIAATGYRVDLRRLRFLAPELLKRVRSVEHTPVLSTRFETSIPGLFFVGPAAANCFGPLMRFACGNRFVARRLAPHLAARA